MQLEEKVSQLWLEMLQENKVEQVILDPKNDEKLMKALLAAPAWDANTIEDDFVFFVREKQKSTRLVTI